MSGIGAGVKETLGDGNEHICNKAERSFLGIGIVGMVRHDPFQVM